MIAIEEMIKVIIDAGLPTGLLILFVAYFFKRDKDREACVVEERVRLKEELKSQKEAIDKELDIARKNFEDKEALILSENAKREELIRKESDKRENIIREDSLQREQALMTQLDRMNTSMESISRSMSNMDKSMESITKRLEILECKVES